MTRREFTPTTEYRYNRTSPGRWILSHVLRYPLPPLGVVLAGILANTLASWSRVLPGRAFDCVLGMLGLVVPIVALGTLQAELLLVPLVYIVLFVVTLRRYIRELNPVSAALREQFGTMNAGLAETISGIEVVKANAQEIQEQHKFAGDARKFRDLFVQRGEIQARYLPLLIYAFAYAGGILQALLLF